MKTFEEYAVQFAALCQLIDALPGGMAAFTENELEPADATGCRLPDWIFVLYETGIWPVMLDDCMLNEISGVPLGCFLRTPPGRSSKRLDDNPTASGAHAGRTRLMSRGNGEPITIEDAIMDAMESFRTSGRLNGKKHGHDWSGPTGAVSTSF